MMSSLSRHMRIRSLKMKLVAGSLTITLILGLVSIGVLEYIISNQKTAQLDLFAGYARTLNDSITAQFYERYSDVQAFAINPVMQSGNKEAITFMLNQLSNLYGIYDLILVVDTKGKLVGATNKSPTGKEIPVETLYTKDYSNEDWFKAVIGNNFTEDKEKNLVGTFVEDFQNDSLIDQVYSEKKLGNGFSAAIKNNQGITVGVITNRAGSRWVETAIKELYTGLKKSGYHTSEIALLRKDGTLFLEYSSRSNSEKPDDFKYNWDQLLKTNLPSLGVLSAKNTIDGNSGSIIEVHKRKKIDLLSGFTPLKGSKFTEKLGWSILVRDELGAAMSKVNQAWFVFIIAFLIVTVFVLLVTFIFSSHISKVLYLLAERMTSGSNQLGIAVNQLSSTSENLSFSSSHQAAAMEQTSSSMIEISSMIKRSSELATSAKSTSSISKNSAEKGGEIVEQMNQSMKKINSCNEDIEKQMSHSNQRIGTIQNVIQEIGEKTKVINDIVFQTRLLSFNASVESARAGEHGKGFAVVAEEVGNLAAMSGKAAQEINVLLEKSLSTVSGIIEETKTKVDSSILSAKNTVRDGVKVAQSCATVLNSIVSSSGNLSEMVSSITKASQETTRGVEEISSALSSLNQSTQLNNLTANSCADSTEKLAQQVIDLRDCSAQLIKLVSGVIQVSRFIWKDDYLLHVPAMDGEHKILIEKINILASALEKNPNHCLTQFNDLTQYTAQHFSHEEKYMESIDYPDISNHKKIHHTLLSRISEFGADLAQNKIDPFMFSNFLNDWLIRHILGVDMKYAHFSQGKGLLCVANKDIAKSRSFGT